MMANPELNCADMRTLITGVAAHLREAGIEEPRFEAQLLLALALGVGRTAIVAGTAPMPGEAERAEISRLLKARAERRVPFAYLRGSQEFYGLSFQVGPGVLNPRPETEMLVEFALRHLASSSGTASLILDVCSGSGCIGISVLHSHAAARCIALDISETALHFTRLNADALGVGDRLQATHSDLLSALPEDAGADIILSNPPYIPTAQLATLQSEVRLHEPALALDGGADDGLRLVRQLVPQIFRHLKPGGHAAIEIGAGQADAAAEIFVNNGFEEAAIHPDFAGIGRMVTASKGVS